MDGLQVLSLGQNFTATPIFQAAARDILAKRGAGGPETSYFGDLGQRHPEAFVGTGILLVGAAAMALTSIYIFRHVNDEKDGFWKVMGYVGGIGGFSGALILLLSAVGVTAAAFPFTQPK